MFWMAGWELCLRGLLASFTFLGMGLRGVIWGVLV
jgi:hypothetical protein